MTIPVILDGDPANDDALAILAAAGHEQIDLLAVTAVAGHVSVDHAAHNAAVALATAGRHDVEVAAGAETPLVREQIFAQVLDLDHGLDRRRDDLPAVEISDRHGVDVIIDAARTHPGATLVATGPLTNVALALQKDPAALRALDRVVVLGGAWGLGNKSAAAEFNILCDPEAAAAVLEGGLPLTLVPVDATAAVPIDTSLVARIEDLDTPVARFAAELLTSLRSTHRPGPGPLGAVATAPLHDPTALLVAVDPTLVVEALDVRVDVETAGEHTYGRTVIDFGGKSPRPANARVVTSLDAAAVHTTFVHSVAQLASVDLARSPQ